MAVKKFVFEVLTAGDVILFLILGIKGAFDAAWWPAILNDLRAYECPKNART